MGPIVQLKSDGLNLAPGQKVIKAADYLHYLNAEDIVEQARQQARQIKQAAHAAYEEEKQRGYQDGMLEGKMQMSQQMMDTVSRTVEYFANIEEQVVRTVMLALRKLIGEMDSKDLVVRVVKQALSVVRNQKQVTLRVAPSHVEHVNQEIHRIMAGFPGISFIDVVGDARLDDEGCLLESEIGVVDASIVAQLSAIERSLLNSLKGRATRGP